MAESTVKQKFVGDTASADAAIAALERRYNNLESKIRQVGRASRDSSRGASDAMRQLQDNVTAAVTRYVGMQAVLAGVSRWYQKIAGDIERASTAERKFSTSLIGTLALSGDLPVGADVKRRLQQFRGVTEEQSLGAFGGVRGGAPTIGVERALELTGAVVGLAPVLAPLDKEGKATNLQDLQKLGQVSGTLAEVAPGKAAGDIVDLALALQQVAGARVSELATPAAEKSIRGLMSQGRSFEEALATVSVGMQEGLSSEQLSGRTKESRTYLATLNQDEIRKRMALFTESQQTDLAQQTLQQALVVSPEQFALQEALAGREQVDRPLGRIASAAEARNEAVQAETPLLLRPFSSAGILDALSVGNLGRNDSFVDRKGEELVDLMKENNRLQQEQANAERANRPAMNRNAQVEAP